MAVSMSLTPFSNAITATVTELEPKIRLVWYLDGKEFATETIDDGADTHTFTLSPVYFASTHVVKLEIYRADTDELVTTRTAQTSTLYADLPLWNWSESNGQASREQTSEAYQAAITQGLVSNYSHLVWDDLVRLLKNALDEAGLPWLTTYGSYDSTLVGKTYGSLTAQRFNAVIQNIRYPYWTWESLPGSYGYLGRQAVRSGDTVYGRYMTELAKYLNVVLGIYNGTASTRETSASIGTTLAHDAIARARQTAPIWHTSNLGSVRENADIIRLNGTLFGASEHSAISHSAELMATAWRQFAARAWMALHESAGIRMSDSYTVNANEVSELLHGANAGYAPTTTMLGSANMQTAGIGSLSSNFRAKLIGDASTENLAVATMYAVQQTKAEAVTRVDADVFGILKRNRAASTAGASSVSVLSIGSANAVWPVITAGSSDVGVVSAGDLDNSRPKYAQSDIGIITDSSGDVEQKPTERLRGSASNVIDFAAAVKLLKTIRMAGYAGISVNGVGTVEGGEHTDTDWNDPVRTGNKLYIPQSYHTDRIADGIRIAWKPVAKTDSGMYIPQVFHADQRDNVLSVVCYSPVRTGNTLYIRQMFGDECFKSSWFSPKQDGDELTIYQIKSVAVSNDKLKIDWDRQSELSATDASSIVEKAVPFLSKGWRFARQRGALLDIYQTLITRQYNDGLVIDYPWNYSEQDGEELTVGNTTIRSQSNSKVKLDWDRNVGMSATESSEMSERATPFLSGGWDFPRQQGVLVTIRQVYAVSATADGITIDEKGV